MSFLDAETMKQRLSSATPYPEDSGMEAIGFIAYTVGLMSATVFAMFGAFWLVTKV